MSFKAETHLTCMPTPRTVLICTVQERQREIWEPGGRRCVTSAHCHVTTSKKKLDCEISGGIIRKQGCKLSPTLCTGRKLLFLRKRIVANVNLKWCDAGITTLPKSFQMCLKALSVFLTLLFGVFVLISPRSSWAKLWTKSATIKTKCIHWVVNKLPALFSTII